jgi:putative drug exporter of the RND superfamily
VVTGAALIMVTVFSVFLTLPFIELKVLGVGMAASVLIDATRGPLHPAPGGSVAAR